MAAVGGSGRFAGVVVVEVAVLDRLAVVVVAVELVEALVDLEAVFRRLFVG